MRDREECAHALEFGFEGSMKLKIARRAAAGVAEGAGQTAGRNRQISPPDDPFAP